MNGLDNKKILIIVGIIILLIGAGIWWGVVSSPPAKPAVNTVATTENMNTNTTPTNFLPTYHGDTFTVSYPAGWTTKETTVNNGGGKVVTFQPQATGQFERMSIEALDMQTTSVGSLTRIFTVLHYTETNTTVAGINAMKYTAILPSQTGKLHSTAYLFQKNGKIYAIKFEYTQSDINETLEAQFTQFLNSFSLL